jgi:hypothetical protein
VALLVDGTSVTIEDLVDQDAGVLDTAQNSGINLTTKIGLARQEIQNEVEIWFNSLTPRLPVIATRVEQVVVTPPLKRWMAMHALELVYRDSYFSQLVDRYKAKWEQYTLLSDSAREDVLAAGAGIVHDPMPVAEPPALGSIAGSQPGGTFYASVAWVNAAGQVGEASAASNITIVDGNLMTVTAIGPPSNAIGFNVYAGSSLAPLFQQNDVALLPGMAFDFISASARSGGPMAGSGQAPDAIKHLPRVILRG